jgi:hypothetical protein
MSDAGQRFLAESDEEARYLALPENIRSYVEYNEDGQITGAGTIAVAYLEDFIAEGQRVVEGEGSLDRHWVDNGVIKTRQPFVIVQNGNVFTGIPTGTFVLLDDELLATVTDGVVDITFDQPGTYVIDFAHVAYLPISFTVTQK